MFLPGQFQVSRLPLLLCGFDSSKFPDPWLPLLVLRFLPSQPQIATCLAAKSASPPPPRCENVAGGSQRVFLWTAMQKCSLVPLLSGSECTVSFHTLEIGFLNWVPFKRRSNHQNKKNSEKLVGAMFCRRSLSDSFCCRERVFGDSKKQHPRRRPRP